MPNEFMLQYIVNRFFFVVEQTMISRTTMPCVMLQNIPEVLSAELLSKSFASHGPQTIHINDSNTLQARSSCHHLNTKIPPFYFKDFGIDDCVRMRRRDQGCRCSEQTQLRWSAIEGATPTFVHSCSLQTNLFILINSTIFFRRPPRRWRVANT